MNKKRALHPRQKKISGEVLLFLSYFSFLEKEDHLRYHPLLAGSCTLNWRECCSVLLAASCWLSRKLQEHLLEETHLAAFCP